MITVLLCTLGVLIVALWLSTMALWWQTEEGLTAKTLKRRDVIYQWNKAARLARRSWYGSLRYSKRAVKWSNKKAGTVFVAIFPKSRSAFIEQDMMTGLEHGPSSYYLASLSKKAVKAVTRRPYVRRKKVLETDLPEQEKSDIVI